MNLQLLQEDDIQPLSILFKQFKFTAFNLYGCDHDKIEKTKNILSNTKNSFKTSKSSIMYSDKKNNSIVSETKSIAKKKNDSHISKNEKSKQYIFIDNIFFSLLLGNFYFSKIEFLEPLTKFNKNTLN